jgi:chorismate synthase
MRRCWCWFIEGFDRAEIFPHNHGMASSFGQLFRITTWGESHGGGVGVVVDGCPPRLKFPRRTSSRIWTAAVPANPKSSRRARNPTRCKSFPARSNGKTLGTPICLWVKNEDARSEAYSEMKTKFRPSHADFTYFAKYGIRAWAGGGRASARETVGRVAAGAIAKKILREKFGVETLAYVKQVQKISAEINPDKVKFSEVESNIVRCPDAAAAEKMIRLIEKMRREGNTVGGIVEGIARGVPAGWGEPVFDKLEADLAKAMLSLPASKAFEIGSGFGGILLTGREHNDAFRARGKSFHDDEPFRRHPGRHLERRNDFLPRRVQARRHRHARAGHGGRKISEHDAQRPGPPRSVRAAARRADGRGDDRAGAGGSCAAAKAQCG